MDADTTQTADTQQAKRAKLTGANSDDGPLPSTSPTAAAQPIGLRRTVRALLEEKLPDELKNMLPPKDDHFANITLEKFSKVDKTRLSEVCARIAGTAASYPAANIIDAELKTMNAKPISAREMMQLLQQVPTYTDQLGIHD